VAKLTDGNGAIKEIIWVVTGIRALIELKLRRSVQGSYR